MKLKIKIGINRIKTKIFLLVISVVLLLTTVTGGYFYITMSRSLRDNAQKELTQLLNQIDGSLESQLDIIASTLVFFISNPLMRVNMEKESPENDNAAQAVRRIQIEKQLSYLMINNYLWDSNLIKSVYIFEDRHTYYHIEHNVLSLSESFNNNLKVFENTPLDTEEIKIVTPSKKDRTIYFVKNMKSQYSLKYTGTMIFAIDIDSLARIYGGISHYKAARAFVLNQNFSVLMHTNTEKLGEKIENSHFKNIGALQLLDFEMDGEVYIAAVNTIKKYNVISVIAVPKNQVLSNLSKSMFQYFRAIFLILVIFLILSIFLSAKVAKPIKDIMKYINHMREGNFTEKMPGYRDYELNQLSEVYNKMTDEIEYLINDVYKKQLLLKEAELKSLQSQINPHFLFNVLDTVSWHARAQGNKEINEIITPLSYILRTSIISDSRQKTTIREELKYIEFYLSIQKSRFGDRLETMLNISDEAIMDFYIPRLCIQPVVSNAIVHGLEEKLGQGMLTMNFCLKKDTIIIEILDNGVGFDTGKLDLNSDYNPPMQSEKHTNIGLYNSNKRIKLFYGDEYGLSIQSRINEGTAVTVTIPLDRGGC